MSVSRPRGRLPRRVYWTRRVLVFGVAFALVFGISRLLGGAFGGEDPAARRAAAAESGSTSPSAVSTAEARAADDRESRGRHPGVRTPPAMPSGPCQDDDVRVVPAMKGKEYAGGNVRLTLELTTFASPACNWKVSPGSIAVRLTSGSERIWSSQDCPGAVPKQPVVLRDHRAVLVDVIWSGRRSDPECSRSTQWAEPGWYHISVAAMGSEPDSRQFQLLRPAPVTITPSPTPDPAAGTTEPRTARRPSRSGDTEDESVLGRVQT